MRKEKSLLILGILVVLLPQFGIPPTWKQITSLIIGSLLIYISYLYYSQNKTKNKEDISTESFTESSKTKI